MYIEERLNEEIKTLLENMSKLDPASDGYAAMAKNLSILMDKAIECEKIHVDEAKACSQLNLDNKHRFMQFGVTVFQALSGLVVSTGLGLLWLRYDSSGHIPSGASRKYMDKIMNWIEKK